MWMDHLDRKYYPAKITARFASKVSLEWYHGNDYKKKGERSIAFTLTPQQCVAAKEREVSDYTKVRVSL